MGLLTTYHSPRSQWEEETDIDYSRASTHYAELSRAALELADWTTSPSIRVLQAVLVTGWRYHHLDARSSSFDGPGRSRLAYRTLLHIAYEHCCALGIDTLQIDPNATIAADAFHPNSTPAMRREFGLRLWFSYLCVETLLSDHQIHRRGPITQSILPGMYTGQLSVPITYSSWSNSSPSDTINRGRSYLISRCSGAILYRSRQSTLPSSTRSNLRPIVATIATGGARSILVGNHAGYGSLSGPVRHYPCGIGKR